MDNTDYLAMKEIISALTLQNNQLRHANWKKDKKIKQLGNVIRKMKENERKNRKPYYKNGKRGTVKNG